MPLTVKDGEEISKICKRSPFGQRDKTVVDTSVRRTWELDKSEFQLQNPAWNEYLKSLVQRATSELGVEGTVHAKAYKLLLYEEGAFFKAHKDTEKVPGMFGTLVICLSSYHEGGDVCLSHCGQNVIFDTSSTSRFDLSALSWYADVTHEFKPLTSGYRLVLTYNLVQDLSLVKPSANLMMKTKKRLKSLLATWQSDYSHQEQLIYILDHKYTGNSLRLETLKGRDAAVGKYLNDVCMENGIFFLLAHMTRSTCNGEDYYNEREEVEFLELSTIVTASGKFLQLGFDVHEGNILTEDPFRRDPDSESEGGYTGNEGMPSTYRYHDSVSLLVVYSMGNTDYRSGCSSYPES